MGGNGYSSDDNRSMQLNDNNDRYYSSRGIDRDDDYDDDGDYGDSLYGSKPVAEFKGYIEITEFLPYFERWIENLKINTGKAYETTTVFKGFTTKGYVPYFIGFNYFDKEQAVTWGYYRTRALIDYLADKNLGWTMYRSEIIEYKVGDWNNFNYSAERVLWANHLIYKKNGLDFPNLEEAKNMFLTVQED
jgi:Ca2+-binding RTX toxin-like protein